MYNRLTPTREPKSLARKPKRQEEIQNHGEGNDGVSPLDRRLSPDPAREAAGKLEDASPMEYQGLDGALSGRPPQSRMSSRASSKKRPKSKGVPLQTCLNFRYQNPKERQKSIVRRPMFDREAFLQANFKFTLSDVVDVDGVFDWDDVLEVEMSAREAVMCPISLDIPPTCPHMTPCGHVFSFAAIVRHLMTAGNAALSKEVPCPLCYAAFRASALRSVRLKQYRMPKPGEMWSFVLMKKPKGRASQQGITSTKTGNTVEKFTFVPSGRHHFQSLAVRLADALQEVDDIDPSEATKERTVFLTCLENLYSRAVAFESARLSKYSRRGSHHCREQETMDTSVIVRSIEKVFRDRCLMPESSLGSDVGYGRPGYGQETEMQEGEEGNGSWAMTDFEDPISCQFGSLHVTSPDSPTASREPGRHQGETTRIDDYFFYQSEDGQWIFLHPVNVKCLLKFYGTYSAFPTMLDGRIVEVEELFRTDDRRRTMTWMTHVPKQATITLVELDLFRHLPKHCLGPARDRAQKRRQQQAPTDRETIDRPILDIDSMPPLPVSTDPVSDLTLKEKWKGGAFSFANVTKNGCVPRPAVQPRETTEGTEGGRSRRKKGKKTVLFSTVSSRK